DGRARAEDERRTRQALVENGNGVVDAALEEREHGRVAGRFGETPQEAIRSEKAVDLLIVEDDPAQRLEPRLLALGTELSRPVGEVGQDHPGLAELLALMREDRHLAHFVDVAAVLRRARLALAEEVDPHGLPVGADQVEHERTAISVAGLCEPIELVLGHDVALLVTPTWSCAGKENLSPGSLALAGSSSSPWRGKDDRARSARRSFHRRNDELGAFLDAGGPARGHRLGLGVKAHRIRSVLVEI